MPIFKQVAGLSQRSASERGDQLSPPWPDIAISCGQQSVPYAIAIKRQSPKTFTLHIQSPGVNTRVFDLIAAPEHDLLKGSNVIETRGALHAVTAEKLATEAMCFQRVIAQLPRPFITILVGGSTSAHQVSTEEITELAQRLCTLGRSSGGTLLVTPSRRTGKENEAVLRSHLQQVPSLIWDGISENPYLGMLAVADYVLVTADSICMVSEACATGKPVYVLDVVGGGQRHKRFHDQFASLGITRPYEGKLESWSYETFNEAQRVAFEVRKLMAIHISGEKP